MGPVTTCSFWLPEPEVEPPSVPELPASIDSLTAFYPNSVWPYRHVISIQCHSPFPASGLRRNQRKKSCSWEENALLRLGVFHQVESTCPHQPLALEKSLTRKEREPSPAGSEAIPRLCSSQICLWREVMCVVRGGENRGWGLWKEACELYLQLGWNSKVLPCGNWGFFFKNISPGNIFFDCCTSIKKHDHSNYRRWNEKWCI